MAKGKKGKKKGGKKKKEEVVKDELTEVDREIFQITITDLTNKYERIKARCLELEALNEELQKGFEKLDEDRADIIAYLNRTVQQRIDEIAELQERLEGLRQAKDAEAVKFKERIANLEHEYKVMHEQLTSEIKLLSGKLNSLEEFRLQRDELMKKFKDQELAMIEQEERHKRTLYDVERKFIIGKDKLKKEMEARLVQLSQDFQETTQLRIAATTHRTIRENIALNNEMDLMLSSSKKLTAENEMLRKDDVKLKLSMQLYEQEKIMVLYKNKVQDKIIETLANEHETMEEIVGGLQEKANREALTESQLMEAQASISLLRSQMSGLQQRLDVCKYEQVALRMSTVAAELETKRLQKVLRQTTKAVKEALSVQQTPSQDDAFNLSRRQSLLNNMLTLLNLAHLPEEVIDGTETEMYESGDLGLIAKTSSSSMKTVGSGNYSYPDLHASSLVSMKSSKSSSTRSKSAGSSKSKLSSTEHSKTLIREGSAIQSSKTSLRSIKEITDIDTEITDESSVKEDEIEEKPVEEETEDGEW